MLSLNLYDSNVPSLRSYESRMSLLSVCLSVHMSVFPVPTLTTQLAADEKKRLKGNAFTPQDAKRDTVPRSLVCTLPAVLLSRSPLSPAPSSLSPISALSCSVLALLSPSPSSLSSLSGSLLAIA